MLSTPPTGLLRLPPAAASMPMRSLPARFSTPRLAHGRATVTVPPLDAARSTVVVPVVVSVPLPDRVAVVLRKSSGPLMVTLVVPVRVPASMRSCVSVSGVLSATSSVPLLPMTRLGLPSSAKPSVTVRVPLVICSVVLGLWL